MASLVKFAEDIGIVSLTPSNRYKYILHNVVHAVDVVPVREIHLKIQTLFFSLVLFPYTVEPGNYEGHGEWQLHGDWVLFAITRFFFTARFFFIYLTNTVVKIIVR